MTVEEIKAQYKSQHDTLSDTFYAKKHSIGVSQAEQDAFDAQHKVIWDDLDVAIKTASDYVEPTPQRNLEAEIDDLKAEVEKLKSGG